MTDPGASETTNGHPSDQDADRWWRRSRTWWRVAAALLIGPNLIPVLIPAIRQSHSFSFTYALSAFVLMAAGVISLFLAGWYAADRRLKVGAYVLGVFAALLAGVLLLTGGLILLPAF